jgi:redox-sensitive bicupin YhaK (pirin superfamily)
MIYHRPSEERGKANFGWLDSKHSFSFGSYYDPNHMGISALRVINDDTVTPGAGFGTHGHQDMEIISYVLDGAIEHKDSEGNQHVVTAGEVQRMSAGSGVTHSEFNHSQDESLHFLQIWIHPNVRGIKPEYEQKFIEQNGALTPLATPDGRGGSLTIHQDASMYRVKLHANESIELDTAERPGYLHIIEGDALSNELELRTGDGLGAFEEAVKITAGDEGLTGLWFDLPTKLQ